MNAITKAFKKARAIRLAEPPRYGWPYLVAKPLGFYYRRGPEFEQRRKDFYTQAARLFGFENWRFPGPYVPRFTEEQNRFGGRDGRSLDLVFSRQKFNVLDHNAAPLEWLIFADRLHDDTMVKDIATVRAEAGIAFRSTIAASEIPGLKSPDLDRVPGGVSGARLLAQSKLEAIFSIGTLREDMPKDLFQLLEATIWRDEWSFRLPDGVREKKDTKVRAIRIKHDVLEQVLCGLDCAAVHFHVLALTDFRDRWPNCRFRPVSL
ncbi:MAG: hypothetical protein JJ902_05290 [Roseibium sp.]|nr:hypothetical protein [Roseibium sp.]